VTNTSVSNTSSGHADDFRMTPLERNASIWLALLYGSRMLGMFLILPVFAVHAAGMPGGSNAALVGLAFGIYGLTQALFQIPFGAASDRFGRKPVITAGLLLMLAGSLVAAAAETLTGLTVGRAMQGAGAVSAAISALLADTTRDSQRTKAMAMVGAMIGLSFAVSLVAAPLLYRIVGLSGIFVLTGLLAVVGIAIVWWLIPSPASLPAAGGNAGADAGAAVGAGMGAGMGAAASTAATGVGGRPRRVLNADMMRLNFGIFVLHMTQMTLFVVVPARLVDQVGLPLAEHWKIYLPVVIASFAVMMPPLNWAEKAGQLRGLFLFAIGGQFISQAGFAFVPPGLGSMSVLLLIFFISFNMLEALMPSLLSRLAPVARRGMAMGVFSTTQALGIFAGGALGGLLAQRLGQTSVFIASALFIAIWAVVARGARRWPGRHGVVPAGGK
jgi:MFS family permease